MAAELIYEVVPNRFPQPSIPVYGKYLRHPDRSLTQTRLQLESAADMHTAAQNAALWADYKRAAGLSDAITIIPTSGGLVPWWMVGLAIIGGAVVINKAIKEMR